MLFSVTACPLTVLLMHGYTPLVTSESVMPTTLAQTARRAEPAPGSSAARLDIGGPLGYSTSVWVPRTMARARRSACSVPGSAV